MRIARLPRAFILAHEFSRQNLVPVMPVTSRPATTAYRRRCDPDQFPDRN
jgi:hypothetical protein